jgi:hypothetical protein
MRAELVLMGTRVDMARRALTGGYLGLPVRAFFAKLRFQPMSG